MSISSPTLLTALLAALCTAPAFAGVPTSAGCDNAPGAAAVRCDAAGWPNCQSGCVGACRCPAEPCGQCPSSPYATQAYQPQTAPAGPYSQPVAGAYSQPAATGDQLGESNGIGIRGFAIRIPEIRLEFPEIRLPSLFHVRRGPQMRTDATTAAFVTQQAATYGMMGAGGTVAPYAAPQTAPAGVAVLAAPAGAYQAVQATPHAQQYLQGPHMTPQGTAAAGCEEQAAPPPPSVYGAQRFPGTVGEEPPPAPAATGSLAPLEDVEFESVDEELSMLRLRIERQQAELEQQQAELSRLCQIAIARRAAANADLRSPYARQEESAPASIPTLVTPVVFWESVDLPE